MPTFRVEGHTRIIQKFQLQAVVAGSDDVFVVMRRSSLRMQSYYTWKWSGVVDSCCLDRLSLGMMSAVRLKM
jgi:hypothetical protein